MATDISEALAQIIQERSISEEAALKIVEETLLSAYKRKFGQAENAIVRFDDDTRAVTIYAQKQVVDGVYDPVTEIELAEAKEMNEEAEEGDSLLIELDPKTFGRTAVQSARQTAVQHIREIRKDSLFSEYKDKEGEIIIGYFQRERNGTIYVDLGKIEGVLPKKFQSPREIYHVNDRIKALIHKVEKTPTGLQVVLSRTHSEFVQAVFELEVPEIYDKTVEIYKIVREPGYRTKLAVFTSRDDVDPVGACVGMKGARIQTIIRELEGEKIDVLKWDPDPQIFIANALSPAEVRNIIILDEVSHKALAVVHDSQLSLAIGKQGLNVRLANRLTDWNIDVKTVEQYEESGLFSDAKRAAFELFGDDGEEYLLISEIEGVDPEVIKILESNSIARVHDYYELKEQELIEMGLTAKQIAALNSILEEHVNLRIAEIEGVDSEVIKILESNNIVRIRDYYELGEQELIEAGLTAEQISVLNSVLEEHVELAEEAEDDAEALGGENTVHSASEATGKEEQGKNEAASAEEYDGEEAEEYECPHCGSIITESMSKCPSCGAEIDWE